MPKNERRKSAEVSSEELAAKLDPGTLRNARGYLAPLAAALRHQINDEDPGATPQSAEAALALRFIYRTFLGRRRSDKPNPENMAFERLLGRCLIDMPGSVENAPPNAEDILLRAALTLGQIHLYQQSGITESKVLLDTHAMPEGPAAMQREIIQHVVESFIEQSPEVLKDIDTPEPGLTVYSTAVLLPDSDYRLACYDYCQEGTALPAETQLLLIPSSTDS